MATGYEVRMYADISRSAKALERIAHSLSTLAEIKGSEDLMVDMVDNLQQTVLVALEEGTIAGEHEALVLVARELGIDVDRIIADANAPDDQAHHNS